LADKPSKVERLGVEHVSEEMRHGSPNRTFTLWFAANLTIADYVIGELTTVVFGFTLTQAIPVLLLGNILGGLLLGVAASMGPSLGFPQMLSSRASFGRIGNYIPGGLNWISTVGWFTVNTILAVLALQTMLPGANFYVAAAGYAIIQAVIAIYGHDFIHLFEKVMSVVLGILFLGIFLISVPRLGEAFAYAGSSSGAALPLSAVGVLLVVCFSYLMSWSPYASDYSRYFPSKSSKSRVALLALIGGAVSSFAVEVVGASLTPGTSSSSPFAGLFSFAGGYGSIAMITMILGAFAADALNLYTNSLSALVLDVKAARWKTVAAGAVVGFIIAAAVGAQFEGFFENFLLALSYWIMPWLAIVIVDFFTGRTSVETIERPKSWDMPILGVYFLSILVSIPFMNVVVWSFSYEGPLATALGGADLSYFFSFVVAGVLTYILRRRMMVSGLGSSGPSKQQDTPGAV
jgi:NCS1 family nucleobase:cation symporter-1